MTGAQQAKLLEIADKRRVPRTLVRGFEITTRFGPPCEHPAGEPMAQHEWEMERACDS